MSDSNSGSKSGGIGVLGLLGVVFVTLKLLHKITWSWWLVTLPFWGGVAIALLILTAILVIAAGHAGAKAGWAAGVRRGNRLNERRRSR
jgi:hypothetical protein